MIKNKQTSNNKGFTIVESLIAIVILVLVITGATKAVQSGLMSYIFSKNQIIAFYLAQEGFEQIRNLRDENVLKGQNWLTDIAANASDPCFFGNACTVDPVISSIPIRCTGGIGNCPNLKQDPSTGVYGYNLIWPNTIFERGIVLTQINANEISVTVTIDWSKGIINRQFKARENLLKWQ